MIRLGDDSETVHAMAHEGTHAHILHDVRQQTTVVCWLMNDGQQLGEKHRVTVNGNSSVKVAIPAPPEKGNPDLPTMLRYTVTQGEEPAEPLGEQEIEFWPAANPKPLDLTAHCLKTHELPQGLGTVAIAGKGNHVVVRTEALTKSVKLHYFTTFGIARGSEQVITLEPGQKDWFALEGIVFPQSTTDAAKGLTYWICGEYNFEVKVVVDDSLILEVPEYNQQLDLDARTSEAYDDAGIVNP